MYMVFKIFIQKRRTLFCFLHTCMYRYRKVFAVTELWVKDGQKTVFTLKQGIKENKTKQEENRPKCF